MFYVFQLFEALDFAVTILVFIMLYSRWLYPEIVNNKPIALIVTCILMFVLFIPYPITKYIAFIALFGYGFFIGFRPWEWGLTDYPETPDAGTFGQPYDAGVHEL